MIAASQSRCQAIPWKRELASAITDPAELLAVLGLSGDADPRAARAAARRFRLLVPRGFAALMSHGDPDDPLLRQVLPATAELAEVPGFDTDPLRERAAQRAPCLLQKYPGRALLLVTGACAIHCRFCFRRHFRGGPDCTRGQGAADALARLAADTSIRELILSGGDPLLLDDPALAALVTRLETLPQLERLRLHTRVPIVLPSRVTADLCRTFERSRLQPVLVVHANHARELGPAARRALARLAEAGVTLLNQSVLLRGVNDSVPALSALSETLFACKVLPYYLHLLDRVAGAAHFDVDPGTAVSLLAGVRAELPGYLVPRLVREAAGLPYKVPVEAGNAPRGPCA